MSNNSKKVEKTLIDPVEMIEDQKILEVDGVEIVEVHDQPQLSLTQWELAQLQLAQANIRANKAELELKILQKELYLREIDPQGLLKRKQKDIQASLAALEAGHKSLETVKDLVQNRLQIRLEEWAYDDVTGLLTKV